MEEIRGLEINQDLILTLDLNEEIIQFNKEGERLTGYTRDEILHKKFSDLLLPEESVQQWKELFESIRQSMWIDNFILPLKIKNKQTYMIAWSGFLVKDETGAIKNICIFGKPIKSEKKPNQPTEFSSDLPLNPPVSESDSNGKKAITESLSKQMPHQSSDLPPFLSIKLRELEKKSNSLKKSDTVVFKEVTETSQTVSSRNENQYSDREKKPTLTEKIGLKDYEKTINDFVDKQDAPSDSYHIPTPSHDSPSSPVKPADEKNFNKKSKEPMKYHGVKKMQFASKKTDERESVNKSVQEKYLKSLATMGSILEATSKKIDSLQTTVQDITQQYEMIADRVAELEKKDRRWQKKYITKNKSDLSLEADIKHSFDELKETATTPNQSEDQQQSENEQEGFFSDPFRIKKQRKELNSKQQQIETRLKKLEDFEAQLHKERSIFNARVEEFSRWREKLMNLESAIEKRRQELIKQEKNATSQHPAISQIKDTARVDFEKNHEASLHFSDETLNKIPQSAAILQRGILKQINSPFEEMLGYPKDELVEKSFFDFIAFEGLGEIEKYYLDRLKGDNVTTYTTVFSTKNNQKIPVEVSIKQTVFNGEKAEIVIVTSLDKKNSNDTTSSVNEK